MLTKLLRIGVLGLSLASFTACGTLVLHERTERHHHHRHYYHEGHHYKGHHHRGHRDGSHHESQFYLEIRDD